VTSSGIKPATYWKVTLRPNQQRYRMLLPSGEAVAFLVTPYEMKEGEPLSLHGTTGEHWDCMMRAEQRD
jgi:hypothetical protein